MFQPQLDIINKSANDEEELNVTKSSFGDAGVAKIEEVSNSDEDSGNSSANSSANEDAKKNLQFQVAFQSKVLLYDHKVAPNTKFSIFGFLFYRIHDQ